MQLILKSSLPTPAGFLGVSVLGLTTLFCSPAGKDPEQVTGI